MPGLPPELDGPADRAPLRLPPRRPVARRARDRAGGRVGRASGSPTWSSSPATCSRGRRGERAARALLERLPPVYAVLGNHDFADSRDPFSKPVGEVDLGHGDAALRRGGDARAARPPRPARRRRPALVHAAARRGRGELADPTADLRILLCHFPRVVDRLPTGRVRPRPRRPHARRADLRPVPGGKLRLAHPSAPYHRRHLPAPVGGAARLARARDDVRPVPVLRPAGGDGARPTNRTSDAARASPA